MLKRYYTSTVVNSVFRRCMFCCNKRELHSTQPAGSRGDTKKRQVQVMGNRSRASEMQRWPLQGYIYLFLTQKKRPVRPRNHKHPKKRTSASAAVAHRRAWKKCAVRLEELDYYGVSDGDKEHSIGSTYRETEAVKIVLGDDDCKGTVRTDPGCAQMGTERLV
jgi:hypothetical protein